MNDVTKVSDITVENLANYLRLSEVTPEDVKLLQTLLNISKTFITKYTGRENLDDFPDFVIVVYLLCQDMYDNRTLYVDKGDFNQTIQTILGMHSTNLL
ncbi:hypothetical protein LDB25A_008 [Lactobacillus phage Ld25A]|uniref:Uncharacterized protein n=1 Tax=Lactobacillus phage Ld25A TaxID=1500734 RepID=A0A075KKZ5_9CAUD|nr:hypothetical protein LDB25A_008 [Lactobacillus phage Ld25A]AIF54332.1 hypothetical protein LDB25A_008 [Lactobacillus phage Ld25A]